MIGEIYQPINLNKANWPLFKSLCGQLKIEDFKTNNIDNYNNNFISKIISIALKLYLCQP